MSAEASDMSSYLLMGLPGLAYLTGLADVGWTAIGLAAGTYVNWLIVSRRVRRYSHQLDAITIPDFFAKRYKDDKNLLTLLAAIVIFVFFVPYTASGFAACGKLFNSLFGVDYLKAMIICAIIIVIYTTLGGFLAASTTDLIQSIVMTIALFIVIAYACVQAGGIGDVIANAKGLAGYLNLHILMILKLIRVFRTVHLPLCQRLLGDLVILVCHIFFLDLWLPKKSRNLQSQEESLQYGL
jgi:sodium/proline symporter